MNDVICDWGNCTGRTALGTRLCRAHLIRAYIVVKDHLELLLDDAAAEPVHVAEIMQAGHRTGLRGPLTRLPSSVVYYVQLPTGDIKIGYTARLQQRRTELRTTWAAILAVEPGGPDREKERHRQFAADRRSYPKEDFAASAALMRHIEDVREQWGDPRELAANIRQAALAG